MFASKPKPVTLDYRVRLTDILNNLSGVAVARRFPRTAADEGRTIECLEPVSVWNLTATAIVCSNNIASMRCFSAFPMKRTMTATSPAGT